MAKTEEKIRLRERRRLRARQRIRGTAEQPRLSVFRSTKHIYAQIIDDTTGRTLAAASSLSEGCRGEHLGCAGRGQSDCRKGKSGFHHAGVL